jgi:DNA-binding NarL/FixJ family response regulator
MTPRPVRIALLEDEHLFRDLLGRALSEVPEIHVVSAHGYAEDLLGLLPAIRPHVVILDLVLNESDGERDINGFEVGCQVRRSIPDCGVVLLSNHADPSIITRLPDADASGWAYLLKRRVDRIDTLVQAIYAVARGDVMIDPALIGSAPDIGRDAHLTAHQMRVLSFLASGLSNAAIAEQLGVTSKSVEHAIGGALQRLGISSQDPTVNARVAAAMAFLRIMASPAT